MPVTARLVPRLFVLVAALLLALVATAAPAAAHERLGKTEPADGAELVEVPTRVQLTFSAAVTDPEPALALRDGAGDAVTTALPVVDGQTVTLPLEEALPNGTYTVEWGIISSDGDPISGEYTFTVAAPATAVPTTEVAPPPATEPQAPTTTAPRTVEASPAAAAGDEGSSVGLWLAIGAAVLAVAVGVAVVVLRRRAG